MLGERGADVLGPVSCCSSILVLRGRTLGLERTFVGLASLLLRLWLRGVEVVEEREFRLGWLWMGCWMEDLLDLVRGGEGVALRCTGESDLWLQRGELRDLGCRLLLSGRGISLFEGIGSGVDGLNLSLRVFLGLL